MERIRKSRVVTFEILRDVETPEVEVEPAEEAIDRIRQITKVIEVIRTNRLIRVAGPEIETINTGKLAVPRTDANMAVILTGRPLTLDARPEHWTEQNTLRGEAFRTRRKMTRAFSIINVVPSRGDTTAITQHESGHMFELNRYDYTNGEGHCPQERCTMEWCIDADQTEFCGKCCEQLERKGYEIAHKNNFWNRWLR